MSAARLTSLCCAAETVCSTAHAAISASLILGGSPTDAAALAAGCGFAGAAGFASAAGLEGGLAGGSGFGAGAPAFRAILRSLSPLVLGEARAKEAREGVGVAPAEAACSSASAAKPAAKRGVLHEKHGSSADIVAGDRQRRRSKRVASAESRQHAACRHIHLPTELAGGAETLGFCSFGHVLYSTRPTPPSPPPPAPVHATSPLLWITSSSWRSVPGIGQTCCAACWPLRRLRVHLQAARFRSAQRLLPWHLYGVGGTSSGACPASSHAQVNLRAQWPASAPTLSRFQ